MTQANAKTFVDSFESGDLSTTNSDGFSWGALNRTSLVTQDPLDGNVVIYNGNKIYNVVNDGRDWMAKVGNNSMRFRYPAEKPMAEQRFSLGAPYRDFWMSFWLRVPTNFYHRTASPSNMKLFALYMDAYSTGEGSTIIIGPWSDGNGGSVIYSAWSVSGGSVGGGGRKSQTVPFISYPNDQGRWMHLVLRFKVSTTSTSQDGIIQMWRKWSGDSSYQQLANVTNANMATSSGGPDGWAAGYLMGWNNPKFPSDTEWLLDNFAVSDQSLLNTKFPKPPVLDSVQN